MSDEEQQGTYEQYEVSGDSLVDKVKALLHEGNVRRVVLKRPDGTTLLDLPVNAGVAVTAVTFWMAPILLAVGAIAAVATKVTLVIERGPKQK